MDAVVGESGSLDAQPVVGLLLERVAGQSVEMVTAELLLITEHELAQPVDVVGRGGAGDVVGFQRIAVSDGGIASDAHRAIVEIAVVVPLLAETRREFQIGNELVDHVDIEVVARHLLLNVQLVGDRQRVLGEIHSPFGLHLNHGAAGVVTVLLVGRKVRQIHQGALDHAVVDHAALGLHHAVLGIVHRIAETHRQPLGDLRVEIQAGVDAIVVRRRDDTVLIHVTETGHVLDSLRTARHRDVVTHDAGIGEQFVLPVGIVLRRHGRAGREIVEHRRNTHFGQREAFGRTHRIVVVGTPRHTGGRSAQTVGVVAGVDQQIAELDGVQQIHLVVELLDSVGEIVTHLGRFALLAALGGDEHDARGAARTVDGGRGGIFQDVDRLDVVRVDENVFRCRIAVDHVKRVAAGRQRVHAAHADRDAVARGAAGLVHLHAGYLARERLSHRRRRHREFAGFHAGDRTREIALAHRCVTHDDHLGDLFVLLRQRDVDGRAAADLHLLRIVTEEGEREGLLGFGRNRVFTRDAGHVADARPLDDHAGPDDRLARNGGNATADRLFGLHGLRGGGGGYRGPAGREHHAVTLDTRPQPLRRERAVDDGDDLLVHRPDAHTRREIDLRIVVSERVIAPFLDFGEELLHRDVLHVDRNFAVLRRRRNR